MFRLAEHYLTIMDIDTGVKGVSDIYIYEIHEVWMRSCTMGANEAQAQAQVQIKV